MAHANQVDLRPPDAAAPTPIARQHLEPQLAQVHPLDLLLHSINLVRAVVLRQVLHVVCQLRIAVVRQDRVLVRLRAAEAVLGPGHWTFVRFGVGGQNYRRLGVVHEARGDVDVCYAAAVIDTRPQLVAARVLLAGA